jgi:hypothetical protein
MQQRRFAQRDTAGVAADARWTFFRDRLLVEARGLVVAQPLGWSARGEVGCRRKALQFRAGALILDGDVYSFGHFRARADRPSDAARLWLLVGARRIP